MYSALVGAGPSALTSAWEPEPQAGAGQSPLSDWSTLGILACDWSIQSTGCCHRHSAWAAAQIYGSLQVAELRQWPDPRHTVTTRTRG